MQNGMTPRNVNLLAVLIVSDPYGLARERMEMRKISLSNGGKDKNGKSNEVK